jgi:uncharacterized protein YjbI with pentapeptide repeats
MTQMQEPAQELEKRQMMPVAKHPDSSDPGVWRMYWQNQGIPWRREPEIELARQQQLHARLDMTSDSARYPFEGVRLNRADLEWLLVNHEQGKGPVDWQDQVQRRRQGIDLRGAILAGDVQHVHDLHGLPLARLRGGMARSEWGGWTSKSEEQLVHGAVQLDDVDLSGASLQGAVLTAAHMQRADLRLAKLDGAALVGAQLEGANLTGAYLEGANLSRAQLQGVYLTGAEMQGANLHAATLKGAILFGTQLKDAYLVGAQLEGANLTGAQLEGANLQRARLGRAVLSGRMTGGDITGAILVDENGVGPSVSAVDWEGLDLSGADWRSIRILGDEWIACQELDATGERKTAHTRLDEFVRAARAYQKLARALRLQGLQDAATYFSYRASVMERKGAWWRNRPRSMLLVPYTCSLLLGLTTGYGYKPWRSLVTYLFIVLVFAAAYTLTAHMAFFPDGLALSVSAFHGRGLLSSQVGSALILSTLESVVGLFIEICFIVVFAKRFATQ